MQGNSLELKSEIVRAGAGAGKTTALVQKVLELYLHFKSGQQRRPRLIVSTFTRKATQELRERLILEACRKQDGQFLSFVMDTSSLHISTLHGVFHLFLASYGHLLDQESNLEILDDYEHHLWFKDQARDQVFRSPEILETFKFSQWYELLKSAMENFSTLPSIDSPLLEDILAAVESYARPSIQTLYSETKGLIESCSSEKWREYLAKVLRLLSEESVFEKSENFLNWRNEFLNLGRKPNFPKSGETPMSPSDFETWNDHFEEFKKTLKKEFLDPTFWSEQIEMQQKWLPLLSENCKKIFELKKAFSKISVGDIEGLVCHVLERAPDLAQSFASDWDYWLIDEFQDTSPIQVQLIEKLRGDRPQFLVGDPQQSIYQFRGAEPEIFGKEELRFRQTQQLTRTLLKNYRSDATLLRFINAMFVPMSNQFVSMEPAKEMASEIVADFFILPEREGENSIEIAIVQKIYELRQIGVAWNDIAVLARTNNELKVIGATLDKFNIPTHLYSNFGFESKREILDSGFFLRFLCNSKDDEALLGLLRSPWIHVGDQALVDLVANQKMTKNSSGSSAGFNLWAHISSLPKLSLSPGLKFAVERLESYLIRYAEKGAAECLNEFYRESGILDFSHFHDPTGRRESNLWKLLLDLRESESKSGHQLRAWLQRMGAHLGGAWGAESFHQGSAEAVASLEPNSVVLMTIHASKGLEFAHVLIPHIHKKPNSGRSSTYKISVYHSKSGPKISLPIPFGEEEKPRSTIFEACLEKSRKEKEEGEFERLLYVATTRAKKTLSFFSYNDVEKGSWIERIPLSDLQAVSEDKTILGTEFSYRIRTLNPNFKIQNFQNKNKPEVPTPWSLVSKRQANRIGVTEVVERMSSTVGFAKQGRKSDAKSESQFGDSLLRGIQFHKAMEKWIHWKKLDQDIESDFFEERIFAVEEFQSAFEYLCSLEHPPFLSLVENGETEFGFIAKGHGQILEGQIDFWSVDDEGKYWIIDYKTGSSASEEKTFLQLEMYAWALCKHLQRGEPLGSQQSLEKNYPLIQLCAVYPFEEKCMVRDFDFEKTDTQLSATLCGASLKLN